MKTFQSEQTGAASTEVHGLEVTVTTATGDAFLGTLVELSAEDTEASFPRDSAPALPIGSTATLTFNAPWLLAPIEVSAQVLLRVEAGAMRRYRYRLKFESDELRKRLAREASRVQNQRTANRVKPAPGESIAVALDLPAANGSSESTTDETHDVSVTGYLKDISTGGIGVVLDPKAENVFAATELVETCFAVPPSCEPLTLLGWIRHRRPDGDRVCYGIEFDTELSDNFTSQLDQIIQYIVRRQEEE